MDHLAPSLWRERRWVSLQPFGTRGLLTPFSLPVAPIHKVFLVDLRQSTNLVIDLLQAGWIAPSNTQARNRRPRAQSADSGDRGVSRRGVPETAPRQGPAQ